MKKPNIFYLCHDHQTPRGGQKETYEHVDILTRNGFRAWVLHRTSGFRLTWFENTTPVVNVDQLSVMYDKTHDYLVLPEDLGLDIMKFPGRTVIFNKSIFCGFSAFGFQGRGVYPYQHPEVVAALAVSEHTVRHLRFTYPQPSIYHVPLDLRSRLFTYEPLKNKVRQIAAMPKARAQLRAVFHILRSRSMVGPIPECPWVILNRISERDTAESLRQSLLFVFTSCEEGLPRMPLEAMSCGCLVVGYSSGRLRGVLLPELSGEYADPIRLVVIIEGILAAYPHRLDDLDELVQRGRNAPLKYNANAQEENLCLAWDMILRHTSRRGLQSGCRQLASHFESPADLAPTALSDPEAR